MRRLLSILLLAIFALPMLLAFTTASASPESRLAACCRRNGAHHCSMSLQEQADLANGPAVRTPRSTCPLFPKALGPGHSPALTLHISSVASAAFFSHPSMRWQVEAWARAARDGARQKRGPPYLCLS